MTGRAFSTLTERYSFGPWPIPRAHLHPGRTQRLKRSMNEEEPHPNLESSGSGPYHIQEMGEAWWDWRHRPAQLVVVPEIQVC